MTAPKTKSLLSEAVGRAVRGRRTSLARHPRRSPTRRLPLDRQATTMAAQHDTTIDGNNDTAVDVSRNETTDALKDVPELTPSVMSGIKELQMIMAGSVPDATPPSQNVLGSPPIRDFAKNTLGRSADEEDERNGGMAIPSPRR